MDNKKNTAYTEAKQFGKYDIENLEYSILYGETKYDKELEDILPDYRAGKEIKDFLFGTP